MSFFIIFKNLWAQKGSKKFLWGFCISPRLFFSKRVESLS